MKNIDNSKNTTSNDAGTKNNSKDSVTDYKYNPRVENPNPKASKNKAPSAGNIRGI
jgi:hypothetical protein